MFNQIKKYLVIALLLSSYALVVTSQGVAGSSTGSSQSEDLEHAAKNLWSAIKNAAKSVDPTRHGDADIIMNQKPTTLSSESQESIPSSSSSSSSSSVASASDVSVLNQIRQLITSSRSLIRENVPSTFATYDTSSSSDVTTSPSTKTPELDVTGEAKTDIKSDLAVIRLTVESRKEGPLDGTGNLQESARSSIISSVQSQVNTNSNRVVTLLQNNQYVTKLQTTGARFEPIYKWTDGTQKTIGYMASNSISFRIRIDQSGLIYDSVIEAGATRIDSIHFMTSEEKENAAKQETIATACKEAKARAIAALSALNLYTDESQLKIVKVSLGNSVTTPQGGYSAMPMMMRSAVMAESQAPTAPIIAGENEVYATCQMSIQF